MERKKIGVYDYTVVLTYLGMLLAFTGILFVLSDEYWKAVLCLMFSGVCDMFDGTVASTKKGRGVRERRFGIQIDSLSDMISFGVFPGLFVYQYAGRGMIAGIIAGAYILAGLIRLAYYNVLAEEKQEKDVKERDCFLGVPITTIAILLPALFLLADHGIIKGADVFLVLLALVGVGFITPVEIKKPGITGKICILAVGAAELLMLILKRSAGG